MMQFKTLSSFLHMGGYAFYVWPAYGFALGVLLVNVLIPIRLKRKVLRRMRCESKT